MNFADLLRVCEGGPPFFDQIDANGFHWISVQNQSFCQMMQESNRMRMIFDVLKSHPTIF